MAFSAWLVGPGGSREDSFVFAEGHLLLVEAKRPHLEESIIACIPEAVGQAIAVLKSVEYVSTTYFTSSSENYLPAFQRSVSVYLMGRDGFSSS
jgi:hypothetical protein